MRYLTAFLLSLMLVLPAYAGFNGPSSSCGGFKGPGSQQSGQVTQAAQVANATDDTPVVLEGNIIEQVRNDEYLFQDASGKVILDIDDKVFGSNTVTPETRVRIHGEVDTHRQHPNDVDVRWLEIIK